MCFGVHLGICTCMYVYMQVSVVAVMYPLVDMGVHGAVYVRMYADYVCVLYLRYSDFIR